jgi:FG-GAP-like repeat
MTPLPYSNDGSENFTKHLIDGTADGAYYALPADLDGDGDQDIVAASRLDDTIAWYRNDGAGSFTNVPIDTNADAARAVFVAGVDGDSRADVLAASVDETPSHGTKTTAMAASRSSWSTTPWMEPTGYGLWISTAMA